MAANADTAKLIQMASFRFVHSADVHLDSPLKGLAKVEGATAERIRSATGEAFRNLVSRTIQEEAAFLVISGDLYDGDWRDYQTGLRFVGQMGRLRQAGIPAFLIYGNHDAQSTITRSLRLPDNVNVLSTRTPETLLLEKIGVALHGQGFRTRDVRDNLAKSYPPPVRGAFNIGLLHTGLAGAEDHAPYAPCTLPELRDKGYDYWALGHIHKPQVLHERPHVVYSGNVQGRHIRETGPRGAMLVTVEDGAVRAVEHMALDVVRWELLRCAVDDCETLADVHSEVRACVERAVGEQADGRLLACRIEVTGRTAAHHAVLAAREELLAQARASALGLGEETAWVEKIAASTRLPRGKKLDPSLVEAMGSLEDARSDEGLIAELRSRLQTFVARLPHEVRDSAESPLLASAAAADMEAIVELARPYALARLLDDR
ncbi:MAG: DNA repair exonuclease [Bryobacterales bacterium]|nr:DNA repair exonuclease [Bryobacterales bacterium]